MNDAALGPPVERLATVARVADLSDHQARMDQPLVAHRLVAAAGRSPAPSPAFLFGPSDPDLTRQIYGQVETPAIGVTSVANAAVAPTGIGLCRDVAFCSAALNHPRDHVATIVARLNQTHPPCRQVEAPLVPLFGPAEEDSGHLLIDYLPRLWLLDRAGYQLDTLHFLVPDPLSPFLEAVVRDLGLPADHIVRYAHWDEVLRTDLLLLPTILRRHERLSPSFGVATRFWTERIRGTPAPAAADRIYVSGPLQGGPVLRNAYRIEAIAERLGYTIVMVDDMNLAERAAVFSKADRIVGPYTTALHHSVFAAAGTVVCALRSTGRAGGTLQTGLCDAMGQRAGYVFGVLEAGGFSIDESDFRRALELMELGRDDRENTA